MLSKQINHRLFTGLTCMLFIPLLFSCRKMVEADPPTQSQTEMATFSATDGATAAVYGMYDLMKTQMATRNGGQDVPKQTGFYSDELVMTTTSDFWRELYENAVGPSYFSVATLWNDTYQMIYRANIVMEGIEKYGKNLPDSLQKQLTGEAKFVRAWAYFLLGNYFGDVPLLLTTDYNVNRLASRSPQAAVYQQIINDLLAAKELVLADYRDKNNKRAVPTERVRANKDVVTAFLAKVYLYMGEWQKAETMASEVIAKTAIYSLNSSLANVFDNNSRENILQVFEVQWYAATAFDLSNTDPFFTTSASRPGYLSDSVVNKFEAGDKRKTEWVGIRTSAAGTWHYPKKYKNISPASAGGQEYIPIMRLAEQYLIRAEARLQQDQIAAGIEDLNQLRARARAAATTDVPNPLPDLPLTLSKTEAMLALEKEWTREMFMEGHRWFNLKRWKGINNPSISRADELMPSIAAAKGATWQPYKKLFPIPLVELQLNPNLVQNPGY